MTHITAGVCVCLMHRLLSPPVIKIHILHLKRVACKLQKSIRFCIGNQLDMNTSCWGHFEIQPWKLIWMNTLQRATANFSDCQLSSLPSSIMCHTWIAFLSFPLYRDLQFEWELHMFRTHLEFLYISPFLCHLNFKSTHIRRLWKPLKYWGLKYFKLCLS